MSEIENLKYIRDNGMLKFIEAEHKRWIFDNHILCVHDKKYYKISGNEFERLDF